MFGAPAGRRLGTLRLTMVDSCREGPATLAVGVGGNGSTEPSLAWAKADANASGQRSRSRPALPSRRNLWVTKPAKVALR